MENTDHANGASSRIRVIITGGTFDKEYDELMGELTLRRTHLPEILGQVRCTVPTSIEISQLVDSLQMSSEGRTRVLEAVRSCPEDRVLITHGTDTMEHTARLLGEALEKPGERPRTVVLTGAMIPYRVTGSDAVFNLGFALCAVQLLPAGVYIAMNARVFEWSSVTKNRQSGVFTPHPAT